MTHLAKVTYYGPTNYRGSRYKVEDLSNWGDGGGKPVTAWQNYDYAAPNANRAAVGRTFSVSDDLIEYAGEDRTSTYYNVRTA